MNVSRVEDEHIAWCNSMCGVWEGTSTSHGVKTMWKQTRMIFRKEASSLLLPIRRRRMEASLSSNLIADGISVPVALAEKRSSTEDVSVQIEQVQLATEENVRPQRQDEKHVVQAYVTGQGVSIWNGEEIGFHVTGTLNLATMEMVLVKRHRGLYKNSIEYQCLVDLDKKLIRGKYSQGEVNLHQSHPLTFEVSKWFDAEEILNGHWSGCSKSSKLAGDTTEWVDVELRFAMEKDFKGLGRITGSGVSLWRSDAIPFDVDGTFNWISKEVVIHKIHRGKYTNRIEYCGKIANDCKSIGGVYQSGTFFLESVSDLPNGVGGIDSQLNHDISEGLLPVDSPQDVSVVWSAGEVRRYSDYLTGTWQGESIDSDRNVTKWTDIQLKFKLHPCKNDGIFEGRGVSIWRGLSIDFWVTGSIKWQSGQISISKKHSGKFQNTLKYECYLKEKTEDGNERTVTFPQSSEIESHRLKLPTGRIFITASYGNGSIVLFRDSGADVNKVPTNYDVQAKSEAESAMNTSPMVGISRAARYQVFLEGVLADGQVTKKDFVSLKKYRKDFGVTNVEHKEALASAGWSETRLRDMTQTASDIGDIDVCTICYTNQINAVILPCGHFSVCISCASRLLKCPICRKGIQKVQRIFRS